MSRRVVRVHIDAYVANPDSYMNPSDDIEYEVYGRSGQVIASIVRPKEVAPDSFAIGSLYWDGLCKMIEECGELTDVCGKIVGRGGRQTDWDGADLYERLFEEMADVSAAIEFVRRRMGMPEGAFADRAQRKFDLFERWDKEQRG